MNALRLCKLSADEYVNVDEIATIQAQLIDSGKGALNSWTVIILRNGTRIPVMRTVAEVIGFIRTQTQDIFSIS